MTYVTFLFNVASRLTPVDKLDVLRRRHERALTLPEPGGNVRARLTTDIKLIYLYYGYYVLGESTGRL